MSSGFLGCPIFGKGISQTVIHVQDIERLGIQTFAPVEAFILVPIYLVTLLRFARVLECLLQIFPSPRASNIFCGGMSVPKHMMFTPLGAPSCALVPGVARASSDN